MPLGHLHVGMTSIQNGDYFWLKTNYRVYLCCLDFLSGINYPCFFLGVSASEESFKVAEIACLMSQIKMATLKEATLSRVGLATLSAPIRTNSDSIHLWRWIAQSGLIRIASLLHGIWKQVIPDLTRVQRIV